MMDLGGKQSAGEVLDRIRRESRGESDQLGARRMVQTAHLIYRRRARVLRRYRRSGGGPDPMRPGIFAIAMIQGR